MVHYTLKEENLVCIENPYAAIKEIFDITDCDIQTTIDNFNSLYEWSEMFDEEEVDKRLKKGHRFFIYYQEDLVVGHCWVDPNYGNEFDIYVYNIYVDKRYHDKSISDSIVYFTIMADKLFSEGYKILHGDVDDWHKNSQSFCARAGCIIK